MKRFLHIILTVLLLAALVMPASHALAGEAPEATAAPADTITVAASGNVTLWSTHMAAEKVSSIQFTLKDATSFELSPAISNGRLFHTYLSDAGLTVYIAGTEPLIASGTSIDLGRTDATGKVTLADNSLKFAYGTRTVIQNAVDEDEVPGGDEGDDGKPTLEEAKSLLEGEIGYAEGLAKDAYTPESWNALQAMLDLVRSRLADENAGAEELVHACDDLAAAIGALQAVQSPEFERGGSGGTIYDGYDDGTGSGAPETTQTPEPSATPGPTATTSPTETPAPTDEPVTTSEPMTTDAPVTSSEPVATNEPAAANATAAPTQAPAVQTSNTGPSAPATGDETVFVPWALMLVMSAAALAVVIDRAKRRQ